MQLKTIFLGAAALIGLAAPAAAMAQPYWGHDGGHYAERYDGRRDYGRDYRPTYYRGYDRGYDRGYAGYGDYGWRRAAEWRAHEHWEARRWGY